MHAITVDLIPMKFQCRSRCIEASVDVCLALVTVTDDVDLNVRRRMPEKKSSLLFQSSWQLFLSSSRVTRHFLVVL